jgi:probable selenium-dependent hydroxylase accessory protein YqeC
VSSEAQGLLGALGIRRGDVVSVVGAGGKTTLVYALAPEAAAQGWRAVVTSTTHMGTLPREKTGPVLFESEQDVRIALPGALRERGFATVLGRRLREDKLQGIAPESVDALAPLADLVLVEADGARQRSLKLPAEHEPVVPRSSTLVVVLAGLDVLGAPLDEEKVHRLERVRAAVGPGVERVDEDALVAALACAEGYPARVPAGARAVLFLNKTESAAAWAAAERLAPRLIGSYSRVAAGSLRSGSVRLLGSAAP